MIHECSQGDKLETIENKIDKLVENINQFKIDMMQAINAVRLEQVAEVSKLSAKVSQLEVEIAVLKEQAKTSRRDIVSPWKILAQVFPWIITIIAIVLNLTKG